MFNLNSLNNIDFNRYYLYIFFIERRSIENYNPSEKQEEEQQMSKNNKNDQANNRPLKTAELFNGFFWDCDKCGHENFERALVPEIDNDIIQAVRAAHNIDQDMGHIMFCSPKHVVCKSCKEQYNASVNSF